MGVKTQTYNKQEQILTKKKSLRREVLLFNCTNMRPLTRMFQSSNHSVKNAGRYFEQFVKIAHPKGQSTAVNNGKMNQPANMYTSPYQSKTGSFNNSSNSTKK